MNQAITTKFYQQSIENRSAELESLNDETLQQLVKSHYQHRMNVRDHYSRLMAIRMILDAEFPRK